MKFYLVNKTDRGTRYLQKRCASSVSQDDMYETQNLEDVMMYDTIEGALVDALWAHEAWGKNYAIGIDYYG